MHDVVVRFTLEDLGENADALSFRRPRGITAKVTPRGAVCHVDERKEDAE